MSDNGVGDFRITMPIAKSYEKDRDGEKHLYIAGIASGTAIDLDTERMASSAITAFKKAIDEGIILPNGQWSLVPLRSGHRKEWDDILGWITKAEIDNEYNLFIEAELDETSHTASELFAKLNRGDRPGKPLQLGFSVGGSIRKASHEWDATTNKRVRVIEDVVLKEISVVGSPANPTTYVEALMKSVNWDEVAPSREEIEKESNMSDTEKGAQATDANAQPAQVVPPADSVTVDANGQPITTPADQSVADTTTEVAGAPAAETAVPAVQPAEEVAAPAAPAEVAQADANANAANPSNADELRSSIASLQDQVTALVSKLDAFANANPSVEKSEEKSETTEKSAEETPSFEDRIANAVTAALESFKKDNLDPLVADMQAMKSTVEEIGGQPMDKSIALRNGKGELDAIEKFRSNVEKSGSNANIIGEAVRAAYRGKNS